VAARKATTPFSEEAGAANFTLFAYRPTEKSMKRALAAALAACSSLEITAPSLQVIEEITFHSSLDVDLAAMELQPNGVYLQELEEGTGPVAEAGTTVDVSFDGWVATTGRQFISDRAGIILGVGEIPAGLDQAIQGMRAGGRRRAVVPPQLAYGSSPNAPVPAGSVVVYEIQLFEVIDFQP